MKTETLEDLFIDQLHDLLSMEIQLSTAFPRLVRLCHDNDLRQMIRDHAVETDKHREVVLKILQDMGVKIEDDECKAIAGLVKGGEDHLNEVDVPHTRDVMMIAHCLRIEHYEIAAYEITTRLGEYLGRRAEVEPLSVNLEEERAAALDLKELENHLLETAGVTP